MQLPEYVRVLFRKAPLTKVIAQIRFPVLPRFGDGNFIAPFQEALASEYPIADREQQQTLMFPIREGFQPATPEVLWRLSTRDRRWSVVLGEAAVTLEVPGYSSIEELLSRFSQVVQSAQAELGITLRGRLGLRYINQIRYAGAVSVADWAALLHRDFVGFAGSDLLGGTAEFMRQEVRVQRPDGTLAIRHGLVKEGGDDVSGEPYYLVDLDYYDATECDLNANATLDQLRVYNDFLYRFFRWTLGEKLYSYLEPNHAD